LTPNENEDIIMLGDKGSEMLPLLFSKIAVDGKTSITKGIDPIK
jgi:hypothetical protein